METSIYGSEQKYEMIIHADILDWCEEYRGDPFHALLCDPPYEYGFMSKSWDDTGIAFQKETWHAIGQHLYPGAFGMAFSGARTWHRLAVAIEDAGFILHPSIFLWVNGQGFPKATRVDTQIDKNVGAEREGSGQFHKRNVKPYDDSSGWNTNYTEGDYEYTLPATALARAWQGHRYGLQALKPAAEPIIVFQKPYEDRPVDDIVETGAGALNINKGRINLSNNDDPRLGGKGDWTTDKAAKNVYSGGYAGERIASNSDGRWPANFIPQHTPDCELIDDEWKCIESCPIRRMDEQAGTRKSGLRKPSDKVGKDGKLYNYGIYSEYDAIPTETYGDEGSASRFFYQSHWYYEVLENLIRADPVRYVPKANRSERDAGLDEFSLQDVSYSEYRKNFRKTKDFVTHYPDGNPRPIKKLRNPHPTIKPISLSKYLASLLLPPPRYAPRRLLVPFAGVASEMIGGLLADWEEIVGIELIEEYIPIGKARLKFWQYWYDQGNRDPADIVAAGQRESERRAREKEYDAEQLSIFEEEI